MRRVMATVAVSTFLGIAGTAWALKDDKPQKPGALRTAVRRADRILEKAEIPHVHWSKNVERLCDKLAGFEQTLQSGQATEGERKMAEREKASLLRNNGEAVAQYFGAGPKYAGCVTMIEEAGIFADPKFVTILLQSLHLNDDGTATLVGYFDVPRGVQRNYATKSERLSRKGKRTPTPYYRGESLDNGPLADIYSENARARSLPSKKRKAFHERADIVVDIPFPMRGTLDLAKLSLATRVRITVQIETFETRQPYTNPGVPAVIDLLRGKLLDIGKRFRKTAGD